MKYGFISKSSFYSIFIVACIPSIIGPLLNIGQWGGRPTPFVDVLISGVPSVIIATYIGYFLIFRVITKKISEKLDAINNSILIFLFSFLSNVVAWAVSQEISFVISIAIDSISVERLGWFEGLIGLPILIWFSLLPCIIVAFANSILSYLYLRIKAR